MIVDEGNAWNIHGIYANAEKAILTRVKKYLADGLEVPDYQLLKLAQVQALRAEAFEIFKLVQPTVAQAVQEGIAKTYTDANVSAYADIGKGLTPEKLPPLQAQAAIRNLNDEVTQAISTAESRILRQVEDVYRESVGDVTRQVLARGVTRSDAVINVVNKLSKQGIGKFTDQAGRNWTLPNYAEMSVRTGTRKAMITGYEDVLDHNDLDLVMVQPGPRACSICDRWARTVLTRGTRPQSIGSSQVQSMISDDMIDVEIDGTLADARADGFQHPNCRCRLRAYLPGITDPKSLERPPWDEQGYKAQQVQRQLENEIRKAKIEEITVYQNDREGATNRVKIAQERLKAHLADNPDLKRQSAREQITGRFGDPLQRAEAKRQRTDKADQKNQATLNAVTVVSPPPKPATTGTAVRQAADLTTLKKLDKPQSMSDASKLSNPGYGTRNPLAGLKNPYDNNCTIAVNALELRARGYDVIAKPIAGGFGRYSLQTSLDWVDDNGDVRMMTRLDDIDARTTVTRMRKYVEDFPVGARGVISGAWNGKNAGAHIFNWEKTADGVVFHEGQIAEVASSPYGDTGAGAYLKRMKPGSLEVLRVDDLTPTNGMIDLSVDDRTDDRLAEIKAELMSATNAKAVRNAIANTQTAIEQIRVDLVEIQKILDDTSDTTVAAFRKREEARQTKAYLTARLTKFESQVVQLQAELAKAK